ncbi:MAG TPA: hypothetical protein V6C71_07090 [Coleofasciculaceae cyanobacterium]|jgi:hypothetical protein
MAATISLASATSEQQAYLVALELLQKLELAVSAETRPNNTSITFDTEASTVSLTVNLDTTMTISNGSVVIAAKPYLV